MSARNIRVGPRLGAAFAAVLVLLLVIAGYGINRISLMRDITEEVAVVSWQKASAANNLIAAVGDIARSKLLTFATSDPAIAARAEAEVGEGTGECGYRLHRARFDPQEARGPGPPGQDGRRAQGA